MTTPSELATNSTQIRVESIVGTPTEEEVAAILAAIEATTPRAVIASGPQGPPAWRFSGRWWMPRKPPAATRVRP